MLVYRESAEEFFGTDLQRSLVGALRVAAEWPRQGAAITALVRAGELECALADLGSAEAEALARITDAAAEALVSGDRQRILPAIDVAEKLRLPQRIIVRPQEGFAYYAVHPLQYAAMVREFLGSNPQCRRAAVIGIRSIGAPLSAVVTAALRSEGVEAHRITVRPCGHPFDRELQLSREQAQWIAGQHASDFLIVDEGPGRSGSSFLSVAEALEREDVNAGRITLLCSYQPDVDSLVAQDAPARWRRFRAMWPAAGSRPLPNDAGDDLSGGAWRSSFYEHESQWPASWPACERLKYLSADGESLLKFEGYGRYGAAILGRSRILAERGFAPAAELDDAGFVRYRRIDGVPANGELNAEVIARLADYCAFRARAFTINHCDPSAINAMARYNLEQICGAEAAELPVVKPVLADGRMSPHEWVQTQEGLLLKTDGASHGDDHFYPGPTDIAWDLAGAIIEWQMPAAASQEFLARYRQSSGDDAGQRIAGYLAAYLAFRIAYVEMAMTNCEERERARLLRAAVRYRRQLTGVLANRASRAA